MFRSLHRQNANCSVTALHEGLAFASMHCPHQGQLREERAVAHSPGQESLSGRWSISQLIAGQVGRAAGHTLCIIVDILQFVCASSNFCDTRLLLADRSVAEDAIKILRRKTNCDITRLPRANGSLPLQHVSDFLIQPVVQHSQSRLSSAQSPS